MCIVGKAVAISVQLIQGKRFVIRSFTYINCTCKATLLQSVHTLIIQI